MKDKDFVHFDPNKIRELATYDIQFICKRYENRLIDMRENWENRYDFGPKIEQEYEEKEQKYYLIQLEFHSILLEREQEIIDRCLKKSINN